ncbi:MAG: DUF6607 family protein [Myxococcota bacterium]
MQRTPYMAHRYLSRFRSAGLFAACLWWGCASGPAPRVESGLSAPSCDPAKDHAAILKMAGTFDVDFTFEETRVLADGYERHDDYHSEANEVVLLLESTPTRVVLQHILLIPQDDGETFPLKHWRQDWVFEDNDLLEFQGNRIWRHRTLSPEEAECTWSQAVFQVDDGPRYESFGRFTHDDDGTATWTSAETWRPLPRREYTKRDDYDVLLAVNRHVIDEAGWRHEQDNRKWVLADQEALVEERGLNTYARVPLEDAVVAADFMEETGQFWEAVRDQWTVLLGAHPTVHVRKKVDGTPLYLKLFSDVETMASERGGVQRRYVAEALGPYVEPSDPSAPRGAAP